MVHSVSERRVAARGLRLLPVMLAAGVAGCDSPAASVPNALPPPPPPATRLAGDYRASLGCGPVSITASGPRKLDVGFGNYPYYVVDLAVETPRSEAMMLDFLRWYDTSHWRVRTSGGRVRHELRVYWDPVDPAIFSRASLPGVRPMTIAACPEGKGGPVLACSERSCEVYEREEDVPEVLPEGLAVLWRSPWGMADIQELREGETLEIPLSYEVYRDLRRFLLGSLILHGNAEDVRISPADYVFEDRKAGDSGTIVFRVTAIKDQIREPDAGELVLIGFLGTADVGPFISPNNVMLRILDAQ